MLPASKTIERNDVRITRDSDALGFRGSLPRLNFRRTADTGNRAMLAKNVIEKLIKNR